MPSSTEPSASWPRTASIHEILAHQPHAHGADRRRGGRRGPPPGEIANGASGGRRVGRVGGGRHRGGRGPAIRFAPRRRPLRTRGAARSLGRDGRDPTHGAWGAAPGLTPGPQSPDSSQPLVLGLADGFIATGCEVWTSTDGVTWDDAASVRSAGGAVPVLGGVGTSVIARLPGARHRGATSAGAVRDDTGCRIVHVSREQPDDHRDDLRPKRSGRLVEDRDGIVAARRWRRGFAAAIKSEAVPVEVLKGIIEATRGLAAPTGTRRPCRARTGDKTPDRCLLHE